MSLKPATGAKKLRELLKQKQCILVAPGVYDGITARLALRVGFDALYMTGAGTSMSRLGWADLGIAGLETMRENAEMIAALDPSVPLIADADTGYGGPIMVSRTVTQYARAGVAALHIEDQVQYKRCGHLLGKQIVDREEYYSRLKAAVNARDQLQSKMLIIARTDAKQTDGFHEAMERLTKAVEIGADIVFLEALETEEEARKLCDTMKRTNTPVLLNCVPGGFTKNMTAAKAQQLGFRIMIVPAVSIMSIMQLVEADLVYLKREGTMPLALDRESIINGFELCGLREAIEIDQQSGGRTYDTARN